MFESPGVIADRKFPWFFFFWVFYRKCSKQSARGTCSSDKHEHSVEMSFLTVFLFLQGLLVVPVTPISEAVGYVGENITLPSGANASFNLSVIEWSIYSNNTWIATYRNKNIKIDRFHLYTGRLTLNTQSGDLTIHNLSQNDTMEYTVRAEYGSTEMQEKIKLTVKQRLQAPTIKENYTTATDSGCFMLLTCSSPDDRVDFSWKVLPHCLHSWNNTEGGSSQLMAYCYTHAFVGVTCTSSRHMETMSTVHTLKCDVPGEERPSRTRCFLVIPIVLFLFVLMQVVCCYCHEGCRRETTHLLVLDNTAI